MKSLTTLLLCAPFLTGIAVAEPPISTNSEGNTVEAALVSVEGEEAVLLLSNRKQAEVPLKTLSSSDQAFITEWWRENKDSHKPMDVRLAITRKTKRIDLSACGKVFLWQSYPENLVDRLTELRK